MICKEPRLYTEGFRSSILQTAAKANIVDMIAHPCIQDIVAKEWYGEINKDIKLFEVILSKKNVFNLICITST